MRNTALSREQWYRKLSPVFKCVWNFLCDECDKAGMWPVDLGALTFFLNNEDGEGNSIPFTMNDFCQFMVAVNEDKEVDEQLRIEWYGEKQKKVWITGFTSFQFGELSSLCIPHKNIIEKLNSYGLLHRVPVRVSDRVQCTLKEKKRQERNGIDKKGNVLEEDSEEKEPELFSEPETPTGQKPQRSPNILPEQETGREEKQWYKDNILSERDKIDNAALKMKIAEYIREKKPGFIEAYMDLWNLSAIGNKLSTTQSISETRLRKFRVRVKEPAFDFIKILEEIKQSKHLKGDNARSWKVTFDWILENDNNYVKIIEGSYRNTN